MSPGQTKMGGLKLYPPLLAQMGLDELIKVAKRPDVSISYTPFGREPGTVYIKGAPVTKGMTKDEMEAAESGTAVADINTGLNKAITASKAQEGVYGTAVVTIGREVKRMPLKAARQLQAGEYGEFLGDRVKVGVVKKVPSKATVRKKGLA